MESSRIKIESINLSNILSNEEFTSIPVKKFTKGNIVYGNNLLRLVVFKSGKAKAIIYDEDREFILYYLEKDNIIIPEESCAVEFLEDSEVYEIDAQSFCNFFKNESFSTAIISSLKQRAVMERKIIKNLVFKTCKNRIASFLLEIALMQDKKKNNEFHIDLNLSINELATFIGSKRQTVSTVFHQLIKDNTIKKISKSKYLIHDIDKLKAHTNSI